MALRFGKQGMMQFRVLLAVVVLIFACGSVVAEPKAYEVVKYKGKAEGLTFALDYGDGYAHASHMKVTDRRGKTTPFGLDGNNVMRFVPEKQSGVEKEIVLKMAMDEGAPDKVDGTYTVDGKLTPFTLRRID
jgi:uncharacterized cupredoxin-like copper-binding protein